MIAAGARIPATREGIAHGGADGCRSWRGKMGTPSPCPNSSKGTSYRAERKLALTYLGSPCFMEGQMTDDQQTPVSDIIANVNGAEERLQELISNTSIDFLGAPTRAFMDKAVTASFVGILLSTIGRIKSDIPLGIFMFVVESPCIIHVSIIFIINYF